MNIPVPPRIPVSHLARTPEPERRFRLLERLRLRLKTRRYEGEAILRIDASEQLSLDQSGIPYRPKGEWVAY